ncbi:MAG: ABC transporter ATP-binding protein [Candidatus Sumerlaeaceae bacterium]|nr:ABC transporter ATP-binding protein [Candidatus Sumerlaeaceae bacterium]
MDQHSAISSSNPVVEVTGLTRRFGGRQALSDVTLSVPPGCVYGLVGENGAGKTTLIRHLLGLLKAQQGSVRVFGMDPVQAPEKVLAEIGYLSEDRDLPDWMRVSELIRYTRAFYPGWDPVYAEELRERFGLDPLTRYRDLSRGQKAMAGLLCALAYRPRLLLLDEPSSGLDAIVRREILGAIIRTVADEGRTVIFSSHFLDEVERVGDRVAMIHNGKLVLEGTLDDVRQGHSVVIVAFDRRPERSPRIPGALVMDSDGNEWTFLCNGRRSETDAAVAQFGARVVGERTASLEDIFVARAGIRPSADKEA